MSKRKLDQLNLASFPEDQREVLEYLIHKTNEQTKTIQLLRDKVDKQARKRSRASSTNDGEKTVNAADILFEAIMLCGGVVSKEEWVHPVFNCLCERLEVEFELTTEIGPRIKTLMRKVRDRVRHCVASLVFCETSEETAQILAHGSPASRIISRLKQRAPMWTGFIGQCVGILKQPQTITGVATAKEINLSLKNIAWLVYVIMFIASLGFYQKWTLRAKEAGELRSESIDPVSQTTSFLKVSNIRSDQVASQSSKFLKLLSTRVKEFLIGRSSIEPNWCDQYLTDSQIVEEAKEEETDSDYE